MKLRSAVVILVAVCVASLGVTNAFAQSSIAQSSKKKQPPKSKTWLVCKHGCPFNKIQKAVDAAGSFKAKKKNKKVKAYVKVKPGKYVEGVVLDGTKKKKEFDGLTIAGTKKDASKVKLEGLNAKGELGPAQNGIEGISVSGV